MNGQRSIQGAGTLSPITLKWVFKGSFIKMIRKEMFMK